MVNNQYWTFYTLRSRWDNDDVYMIVQYQVAVVSPHGPFFIMQDILIDGDTAIRLRADLAHLNMALGRLLIVRRRHGRD